MCVSTAVFGEIYLVTNLVNGKKYIGQTRRGIERRWVDHCSAARTTPGYMLHRAIRKYGCEKFSVEKISVAKNQDELNRAEIAAIAQYDTTGKNGYNLTSGGQAGARLTDESKARLAAACCEAWKDPERKAHRVAGMLEAWKDPERKAHRVAGMNQPEIKASRLAIKASRLARLHSPEVSARRIAGLRKAANRPGVKALHAALLKSPEVSARRIAGIRKAALMRCKSRRLGMLPYPVKYLRVYVEALGI
jgi:group I intron endonuclease